MEKGNLFSIIKQIPEEYVPERECPFCDSKNVHCRGGMVTAVGGGSSVRGDASNPNHYTEDCYCGSCKRRFAKEFKGKHQWYRDYENNDRIVRGFHMCFETATYDCIECGGEV